GDILTIPASSSINRGYNFTPFLGGVGQEANLTTPIDHAIGSRFLYIPYFVPQYYQQANRAIAPGYYCGRLSFDPRISTFFVKCAPVDLNGNEQPLERVPSIPFSPLPYADFLNSSIPIGYLVNPKDFGSVEVQFDVIPGYVYYFNRMFTITTPLANTTYYVYMLDDHYVGDVFDNGFLSGKVIQGGTGYAVGDTGEILHSDPATPFGDTATYVVTQIDSSGGVLGFEVTASGSLYDVSGKPAVFTSIYGGIIPPYQTLAGGSQPGSGVGLVVDCTAAEYNVDLSTYTPRTPCICTTGATK